jgi:hypothetical protein
MALVRVKDPINGAEFTTNDLHAEALGLVVLDKEAADLLGRPLPAKYPVTKGGKPAVTNTKEK